MNRPKVSIGVPVYNAEEFLAASLDSLLAQSMTDFEIVISDNGSTDATCSIIDSYQQQDARVRSFRYEDNRGSAWNFNNVFAKAKGEYFKWQAYDDLCAPTFLERCCQQLDQNSEIAWCHPLTIRIDQSTTEFPTADSFTRDRLTESMSNRDSAHATDEVHSLLPVNESSPSRTDERPSQRFRAVMLGTPFCSDAYALIRRDTLAQTRLELPFYGSEKPMLAELALLGKFHEVPEVLFAVREHPGSSGSLTTANAQQAFVVPGSRGSSVRTRFRLLQAYLAACFRHPIGIRERISCLRAIVAYVAQFQKWKRAGKQIVRNRAVRGCDSAESRPKQVPM